MKSRIAIIGTAAFGLLLAAVGFGGLQKREEGVKFHGNPFAVRQSGYGMILARLSQDTVNKVWHLGVEQVNPVGHVHGPECEHLHGHGGGEDDHAGHDHGEGQDHEEYDHEGRDHEGRDHEGRDHEGHDHEGHDHEGHDHEGHDHEGNDHEIAEVEEEAGHVHGPECAHGHCHEGHDQGKPFSPLASAKDWIGEMKTARYARTNPYGINEAHRLAVAQDIEETLLRSYTMDPTNYGVYNAYYLFLTIHELRATPRAKDHARKVSNLTIGAAFREKTNPAPWLTASVAVLNLFFLDQEKWRAEETDPPAVALEDYRQRMGYCLQQYAVLKQRAIAEGRWKAISGERRQELNEREQFATKAFAQFDAMLARQSGEGAEPATSAGHAEGAGAPVAKNAGDEADSSRDDR